MAGAPVTDIVKRLRVLVTRDRDPTVEDAREAADEIERLRAALRVNGLRWGHTHAEIDALLTNGHNADD
jgi:hypothetical protein